MIEENVSEDLDVFSQAFWVWHPDEFQFVVGEASLLVIVVEAGEEPSIEAHFGEEAGVGVGMAEWIDLPTDSGFDAELLHDEVVAHHHVVYHIFVDWAGLVMHRPTSVNEFKLATSDKSASLFLHVFVLLIPPHFEELHLHFRELSARVLKQRVDYRGKFDSHHGSLNILLITIEVLIDRLQPSDIVV